MGCNWIRGEMVASAPEGEADIVAYLAGRVMPSAKAKQQERIGVLLAAGGEMR
jgi:hypothetical protein